jgi:hypothetical protein
MANLLGDYVVNERAVVRPGLVGLADLAAADFGAMTQAERVDALLVVEQHRAWLDGVQQQLLSEVAGMTPAGSLLAFLSHQRYLVRIAAYGEDYHAAFQLGPDQTLAGVLDEYEQVGRETAH